MLKVSLVAIAIAVALVSVFRAQETPSSLPSGSMQQKATTACMECHNAQIIQQQRLSKAAWTKEVDKMAKWGALVEPQNRDALIDYLSTNFGTEKPPYQPPRTASSHAKN